MCRDKRLARLGGFFILLFFMAICLEFALAETVITGQYAPDFSLTDLNGQAISLSDSQSENTILFFGTTWCPNCRQTIKFMDRLRTRFSDEQLSIVFIAVRQDVETVSEFFYDKPILYDILADETGIVSCQYGIKQVPVCVLLDADGLIKYVGKPEPATIVSILLGKTVDPDKASGKKPMTFDRIAKKRQVDDKKKRRYIVQLDESSNHWRKLSKAQLKAKRKLLKNSANNINARIIHGYGKLKNNVVVEIDAENIEKLKQLPGFKHVEEDTPVYALLSDSAYQVKADYAWNNAIAGQGVNVCVVDTGIDYNHPDLRNAVVAQYNPINGTNDAMDDNGHGTHVAGIIASQGLEYRGISYDVALMAAKVLSSSGTGYVSDVMLGINWCVDQGANVINLSVGEGLYNGTCDYNAMAATVNDAVDAGVVTVCASGNDGNPSQMVSPACASKAIAVGSVDKMDSIASYSDGGVELDLVAPGGDAFGGSLYPEIVSPFSTEVANNPWNCLYLLFGQCYDDEFVVDGTRYIRAVGTSMAAPHVAGAAALMLEENGSLSPAEIKTLLQQNADDLGDEGWDNVYGWGRINIEKTIDNLPPEKGELSIIITDPNAGSTYSVNEPFDLIARVDCFGGDGCGDVTVTAKFCADLNCSDFLDITTGTQLYTDDDNPVVIGALSGLTVETDAPVIFDARTTYDISDDLYTKDIDAQTAQIGSTMMTEYNTGDLEPADGIGAIGEDAEAMYEYEIPYGTISKIMVRMEHYLVLQLDGPDAGWSVYTSDANGVELHLIGECTPITGGGGAPPPPDCWFISTDPNVTDDLTTVDKNYIKLVSHDVGDDDWLTFNDIEVTVEYQPDMDNDQTNKYYIQFDLSETDPNSPIDAARLNFEITQGAQDAVADIYVVNNSLAATDDPNVLDDPGDPSYSQLLNPIKSFSCSNTSMISVNVSAAVKEAHSARQSKIAFQIRERNNDQLFAIKANGNADGPMLTLSQKVLIVDPNSPISGGSPPPQNGPRPAIYDTVAVKDISAVEADPDNAWLKNDYPADAIIGSPVDSEYSTGDLEDIDGIGAIGEDAQKIYEYTIPDGTIKKISIRMEHYLVLQWVDPPAGWDIYTADPNAPNPNEPQLHLIGSCTPISGGGGYPEPPDCWFVSEDPDVLYDLVPGGINNIIVVSHDVGDDGYGSDWLTYNDLEIMIDYQIDPNNDNISRYYMNFDISDLPADTQLDSAQLNLYVSQVNPDAVAQVNLVDGTYDPNTGAYTIYNADPANYSSLINPIKIFTCNELGTKQLNVKAALEDAIENNVGKVAFLITEQNEDALFGLGGSTGPNAPKLDIYLKSETTSGLSQWQITPLANDIYTVRVYAEGSTGVASRSDAMIIAVLDPNRPMITSAECMVNSMWQDCRSIAYGDTLKKIRATASDPQEIPNLHVSVKNVPDDTYFANQDMPFVDSYFTAEPNILITESGNWQMEITATDSDDNSITETVMWYITYGRLESYIADPNDLTVAKGSVFGVTTGLRCLDAECPDVSATILLNEPNTLTYDDGTAEDYGDIGWLEGFDSFLAVRFTPDSYPLKLTTAKFFIQDITTYPFELHVWDDGGIGGAPGSDLVTPFIVDPIVDIAWFDVDLSQYDITINSGDFYIGWRQLEENKNNKIGFDTNGSRYTRTWAYFELIGWFNLDNFCSLDDQYCGNIMIRATMTDESQYEGIIPSMANGIPFYTKSDHSTTCGDLKIDESCQVTFNVHAIGAVNESAKFYASASNNYSYSSTPPITVTITPPESACDAANLDAAGTINFEDFMLLSQQWAQTTPPLGADIVINGSVDIADLAEIAKYWLDTCP